MFVGLFLIALACHGQKPIAGTVSGGLVFPLGESLKNAYTIGLELGAGMKFNHKKAFLALEASGEIYVNRPPSASSIADQLVLFGPTLQIGYSFPMQSRKIEPFIGIGYAWGVNSINDGKLFSSNSVDLLNVRGISFGPGFAFRINENAAIDVCYKFYSPDYTLTQDAQSSITSTSSPTQLYGPLVVIPEGSFRMNRLILRFNWTF